MTPSPAPVVVDPAAAAPTPSPPLSLVLVLGAFIAVGPFTIDLYLPALPTITDELGATASAVQLTLTGTLIGLALGQLVIGPLSDRWGRKRPLVAGAGLHVLASIAAAVAPNLAVLGGMRVLQGIGAAAGAVIAMAVVRDLYVGRAAAVLLSRLVLVMGAAPVIAPTLGGWLLGAVSWRGLFVVLALYALVLVPLALRVLPETLPPQRRVGSGVLGTLRTYRRLLRDRTFLGLVLVAGLTMSGVLTYVAGASFVFQEQFGLTQQQFGLAFGSGAIFLIGSTQLNPVLLRRFGPHRILPVAVSAAAVLALGYLVVSLTGSAGVLGALIPLWLIFSAIGFALPNTPALALARHGEVAGTAAALLGAVQFGVGAVISPVVGLLGNDVVAMSGVMAAGLVLAALTLFTVVRLSHLPDPEAVSD